MTFREVLIVSAKSVSGDKPSASVTLVNSTEEPRDLMCDLPIRISGVSLLDGRLDPSDGPPMLGELGDIAFFSDNEIRTLPEGCNFSDDGMIFR